MPKQPKYCMDIVFVNAADFISSILTAECGSYDFHQYEIEIRPAPDGWEDIWCGVYIRYKNCKYWNEQYGDSPDQNWVSCGNRHGGRSALARLVFADMKRMDNLQKPIRFDLWCASHTYETWEKEVAA